MENGGEWGVSLAASTSNKALPTIPPGGSGDGCVHAWAVVDGQPPVGRRAASSAATPARPPAATGVRVRLGPLFPLVCGWVRVGRAYKPVGTPPTWAGEAPLTLTLLHRRGTVFLRLGPPYFLFFFLFPDAYRLRLVAPAATVPRQVVPTHTCPVGAGRGRGGRLAPCLCPSHRVGGRRAGRPGGWLHQRWWAAAAGGRPLSAPLPPPHLFPSLPLPSTTDGAAKTGGDLRHANLPPPPAPAPRA